MYRVPKTMDNGHHTEEKALGPEPERSMEIQGFDFPVCAAGFQNPV